MAMLPLLIAMTNRRDPLEEPTAAEHGQRCRALPGDVRKAWLDVVLAGPAEVAHTASEIEECCRKLAQTPEPEGPSGAVHLALARVTVVPESLASEGNRSQRRSSNLAGQLHRS